ncbi:MAG: winged helix-turn-helix transcriptional regulator [Acidimicrobiales bacterium]
MGTTRTYNDACAIARGLDVVGERWALLIVRELVFGPRRFSDLRKALPNASTNLLTDRLRELESNGIVGRRRLSPPAGSTVYELTAWGAELAPVLDALGQWALRGVRQPSPTASLSATSVLLFVCGAVRPDRRRRWPTIHFELDDSLWTARVDDGTLRVRSGEHGAAELVVRTDPWTLNRLLDGPHAMDAAMSDGRLVVDGDGTILRRLLGTARPPAD